MKFRSAAVVLTAVVAAACQQQAQQPTQVSPVGRLSEVNAPRPTVSAPFDVRDVIQQVQNRFVSEGPAFAAVATGLKATIRQDGSTELVAGRGSGPTATIEFSRTQMKLSGLQLPTGGPVLHDDGAVSVQHGVVRELWRNEGQRLQQSWTIDAPTTGSWQLRIAVAGAPFEGSNVDGLSFRSGAEPAILYSHAVLIDAEGARTPIPAAFISGGIELTVPETVLAAAAFPVTLDPFVSSTAFDTDPGVLTAATANQLAPAVAYNGNVYLVVWEDFRNPVSGADIWGTIVTSGGVVQTARGFLISGAAGAQRAPNVASDGSQFFVVWQDQRDFAGTSDDIYGTQVLSTGVVVSPDGVAVAAAGQSDKEPVVVNLAANQYAVAWTRLVGTGNNDIYARRVGTAGAGDGNPVLVASGATNQFSPAMAVWGTNVVGLAWSASAAVQFGRVNLTTETASDGATGLVVNAGSTRSGELAIASGAAGAGGVVVWADSVTVNNGGLLEEHYRIWAKRVSGGATIDAAATLIQSYVGGINPPLLNTPQIAWDGSLYRILFSFGFPGSTGPFGIGPSGTLRHTTMSTAAAVGAVVDVVQNAYQHQLVGTPGSAFYVWTDITPGNQDRDVRGVRSSPVPSAALTGALLTQSDNEQFAPALGFDGTNYLLAWADNRNTASLRDLYAMRVSPAGAKVDAQAIRVTTGSGNELDPRIGGGPEGFLLVYNTRSSGSFYDSVEYAIVETDGGVQTEAGQLHAAANIQRVRLGAGWDGTQFVAGFGEGTLVRMTRVQSDGTNLDPGGAVIADAGGNPLTPVTGGLAVTGARALVAYRSAAPATSDFYVGSNQVSTTPQLVAAPGVVHTDAGVSNPASVATNGTDYLLAWYYPPLPGIMTQLVRGDGGLGALQPLATTRATNPAAVWDGTRFAVVFEYWGDAGGNFAPEVHARWLDADGTPEPGPSFQVHAGNPNARTPAAASDGRGHILVAYSEFTATSQSSRVHYRVLRFQKDIGEACGASSECRSGQCVEGVCCNSACSGPCDTCTAAAGAVADGYCTALPATVLCRPASTLPGEICDVAEFCSGTDGQCPADGVQPLGVECRPSVGPCDLGEVCDGVNLSCLADARAGSSQTCRVAQGQCDVEEKCDGTSTGCPVDVLRGSSELCQPASSCREATSCSGSAAQCPAVTNKPDGESCPDATDGICRGGECVSATRASHYALISCSLASGGPTLLLLLAVAGAALRRRRLGFVAALLCVFAAETADAAEKKLKLTYMGLAAGQGMTAEEVSGVTNFVQSQIAALDVYQVIGASEVHAIIGVERQKELLGCGDSGENTCLMELAGALDADRAVSGDVSVVSGNTILNLSLIDLRTAKTIKRVGRRVDGSKALDALLDVTQGAVVELVSADPAVDKKEIKVERGFGGVVAGLRVDSDVAGRGIAPGVTAEISGRHFGGALAFFYGKGPGARAEGRFYPVKLGIVRPYVGVGASVFAPDVAVRGSLGAAVALGSVQIFGDAAFERFVTADATGAGATLFAKNAVLLGLGAGWAF